MAANVQILAAMPDYGDNKDMVQVRFLVDGKTVKYGLIYIGAFHDGWYKADQVDNVVLPELPEEWTWICICADHETGEPFVLNYHNNPPECEEVTAWHPDEFEYAEIEKIRQVRVDRYRKEDRMWVVQHPSADKRCLMKISEVPKCMELVKCETATYRVLEGSGVAPQFMGHVTEQGRIVGFLIEWIEGAEKPMMDYDTERVMEALSGLHALGILHNDAHAGNFLVKNDRAYIIDFEYATWCNDPVKFDMEIDKAIRDAWLWEISPSPGYGES